MPDISFPSSPSLNDTYTYNDITFTWDGEKWTAYSTLNAGSANYSDNQVDIHLNQSNPTNGHVLSWTSGDYAWVAQSGGGSSYADSDVDTHLNQSSASSGQVLTWNGSDYAWTAKTVDTDTDAQTLSLSGNVITISGSSSTVDLTTALGTGYFDPTSEITFTKDVHFNRGVEEKFGSLSGQSGTVAHNLNDGHVFYHTTPAGDFTANFTNFNLDDGYTTSITIIVNQGVTARVVSAVQISGSAQTINWQGGSAPTGTANGLDAFSFTILRNGSSYIVLGQMVDFA